MVGAEGLGAGVVKCTAPGKSTLFISTFPTSPLSLSKPHSAFPALPISTFLVDIKPSETLWRARAVIAGKLWDCKMTKVTCYTHIKYLIQQTFQVWLSTGSIWQNNNYPNEARSRCLGRRDQSEYCQVMSAASSPYEISNQKYIPPSDEARGISRQIIKVLLESAGSCCEGRRPVTRQGRVKCSFSDQQDEMFSRLLPSDKGMH